MTEAQEQLVRAYMQNGDTLEKSVEVLKKLAEVKQTDEEALAILFLLMATTKEIIEKRQKKDEVKVRPKHSNPNVRAKNFYPGD